MRPIIRGPIPKDETGNDIIFTKYSRSRRYLIDRIGGYCSYCERKIEASLAVEHIQPKSREPELELSWDNFLLACTNCNSTKGDTIVALPDFVWPDVDNTFALFTYDDSGIVKIPDNIIDDNLRNRIQATLNLVGLQKHPPRVGTLVWAEASDRRYELRIKAWAEAVETNSKYANADQSIREIMLPLIKIIVINQGFWSIWMQVFHEFPEVQRGLLEEFTGTNTQFFQHLYT